MGPSKAPQPPPPLNDDDDDDDDGEGDEDGAPPGAAYDATDDIQDIDRRLNALQQFLTAAKAPR